MDMEAGAPMAIGVPVRISHIIKSKIKRRVAQRRDPHRARRHEHSWETAATGLRIQTIGVDQKAWTPPFAKGGATKNSDVGEAAPSPLQIFSKKIIPTFSYFIHTINFPHFLRLFCIFFRGCV
jgi:hypothetical protein